jgi:hypothetical protein
MAVVNGAGGSAASAWPFCSDVEDLDVAEREVGLAQHGGELVGAGAARAAGQGDRAALEVGDLRDLAGLDEVGGDHERGRRVVGLAATATHGPDDADLQLVVHGGEQAGAEARDEDVGLAGRRQRDRVLAGLDGRQLELDALVLEVAAGVRDVQRREQGGRHVDDAHRLQLAVGAAVAVGRVVVAPAAGAERQGDPGGERRRRVGLLLHGVSLVVVQGRQR